MGEEILKNYGVVIGILVVFLWAFRKILSAVLDDKTAMMKLVAKNTEAFTEFKSTSRENKEAIKEIASGMKEIHEYWKNKNGERREP